MKKVGSVLTPLSRASGSFWLPQPGREAAWQCARQSALRVVVEPSQRRLDATRTTVWTIAVAVVLGS